MSLESSKNLGGIGAILIVIGLLPVSYIGILALIGLILVLIGLKGLADFYKEGGIFNNALYAIILAIVGIVVVVATLFIIALTAFASLGITLTNPSDWANLGPALANRFTSPSAITAFLPYIGAAIGALVVLFVFAIVSVIFFRRSLNQLSSKTGVGLFGTAGLLMLVGAVLTIVIIGLLLIWIAFILMAVAFFRISAQPTQAVAPPAPSPS